MKEQTLMTRGFVFSRYLNIPKPSETQRFKILHLFGGDVGFTVDARRERAQRKIRCKSHKLGGGKIEDEKSNFYGKYLARR